MFSHLRNTSRKLVSRTLKSTKLTEEIEFSEITTPYQTNKGLFLTMGLLTVNRYNFCQQNPNKKKLSKQQLFKKQEEQRLTQQPDQDPTTYDKSSTVFGKVVMGVFIAGLLGAVVWAQNKIHDQEVKYDESISGVLQRKQLKKLIGGDWSLIDMHGKPITHTDLEGSYYLIYFGFTKCPDICPATLIKLSRVLRIIRKLPENHYINLKIVFISCDPDRDTPQRLREYLKNFDDEIVGVTASSNNDPELLNVMKSFKIYTNRIDLPNGDYTMDHTTITYLMDQNNNFVDHINPNGNESEMAKAIVNKILDNDYKNIDKNKDSQSKNQGK